MVTKKQKKKLKQPAIESKGNSEAEHKVNKERGLFSNSSWSAKILSSLVGIVVTFTVGDVLIKRNYEGYIKERSEFYRELEKAKSDFDQLLEDMNNLIAERRGAAQQLNRYAASGEVAEFIEYYSEYEKAVRAWNRDRKSVERRIIEYTDCTNVTATHPLSRKLEQIIVESKMVKNTGGGNKKVNRAKIDEYDSINSVRRYCPNRMVFGHRGKSKNNGKEFLSVYEVMTFVHHYYYISTKRDIVKCAMNTGKIMEFKIQECKAVLDSEEISACIQNAVSSYSASELCTEDKFKGLADIDNSRYDAIDYRWRLAERMLLIYREQFIVKRCDNARKFWARYLGWSCSVD